MNTRKWHFLLVALLAFSVGIPNVSAQVPINPPMLGEKSKTITKAQPNGRKADRASKPLPKPIFENKTIIKKTKENAPRESKDDIVYEVVEQMPKFPGGDAALMQYLSIHVKYPATAEEKGISGRVVCTFIVEKDGSISNVQVAKGVEASLDKEAVRVLKSTPKWIPGKHNGKAVRVMYRAPVTFRWEDGNFVGKLAEGNNVNQETKTQPHGGKAIGDWKNGTLYNGRYERYRTDSEREYTVNVVNGKYQGQGTVYYYSGSYKGNKYVGEFADGRSHGQGTFTWADGGKFVGQWKNGKRNGQGTNTWPSGSKYVGNFIDDKPDGQGTYTWPDGSKFVGRWKNGKREGFGTYYLSDGKVSRSGQWKDDKFVGK